MKILLINPPHPSIGSRIPREHLPPLGLLSLGGPLLDAGNEVKLLDAEFGPMKVDRVLRTFGIMTRTLCCWVTPGPPQAIRARLGLRERCGARFHRSGSFMAVSFQPIVGLRLERSYDS